MKRLATILAPLCVLISVSATAQPAGSSHEQHQATGEHPADKTDRCCCDEEMRQMMKNMMRMHQGEGHQPGQKSRHEHQPTTEHPKQDK